VTPPPVQSVTLQSSQTAATSSTGLGLKVQVSASQTPSQPGADNVSVTVSDGASERSEIHEWTFPVDASALTLAGNGAGTLTVPDAKVAPYGTINLKIKPIGKATTDNCGSVPRSQTQKVAIDGTFFFDTKSKGSHPWGTVGSQSAKFTFSDTNTVTTSYLVTDPACFNFTPPCATSVFWQSGDERILLDGVASAKHGLLFGSRTKDLTAPAGATRHDEAFGTTKKLVLKRDGAAASLSVKSAKNTTGSAKIRAKKHHKPSSSNCTKADKPKVQTSTIWDNARYKNGSKPLAVHAQIFGKIKVANNRDAEIIKTVIS
jgi:hypothetical protein